MFILENLGLVILLLLAAMSAGGFAFGAYTKGKGAWVFAAVCSILLFPGGLLVLAATWAGRSDAFRKWNTEREARSAVKSERKAAENEIREQAIADYMKRKRDGQN